MRDIKRIKRITNLLCELWKKNPDYRFYQMLINEGIVPDSQVWFVEDDHVENHIKERIEKNEEDGKV